MQHLKTIRLVMLGSLCLSLSAATMMADSGRNREERHRSANARLSEKVRHELAMLPYYGVFDNLQYQITGLDTVVLSGQVTNPTLKKDAESSVRGVEGVSRVVNRIEVLPLSPNDDRIRRAVFHAIYSKPGLDRYGLLSNPSIHIIVKNGNVRLVGVVDRKADKDIAFIAANGVSGVFSVKSDLVVERRSS